MAGEQAHNIHPLGCSDRHVVLIRAEKTPEDAYKKVPKHLLQCVRNLPPLVLGSAAS